MAEGLNRRSFLRLLGLATAGAAVPLDLDPERALWVPGRKRIFIPPVNQFVTPDWITREALKVLEQNLRMVKTFNRHYDEASPRSGVEVVIREQRRLNRLRSEQAETLRLQTLYDPEAFWR